MYVGQDPKASRLNDYRRNLPVSEKTTDCDADQDRALVFEQHRRRLLGVSYRILGSVTDAEDVLQDAWLRWSTTDAAQVNNPEAFLTTVVSRLSLQAATRQGASRGLSGAVAARTR
jgi:DNA-directed RNA polymerase specialized sigma24 family protein